MTRVAVCGVFHETNRRSPERTEIEQFAERHLCVGAEIPSRFQGTESVVGGFLDGLEAAHARAVPAFYAWALPSGLVTDECFLALRGALADALRRAEPVDAVLVELHGAMTVAGDEDPDATLLEDLRGLCGDRPLVAVTDLHANVSASMIRAADAIVGYETNPHVDMGDRGREAADAVLRVLAEAEPTRRTLVNLPLLLGPHEQDTSSPPLSRVQRAVRDLKRQPGVLAASFAVGYPYSDVPKAGFSVFASCSPSAGAAIRRRVEDIGAQTWAERHELREALTAVADVAAAVGPRSGAPVAVADTGDNIGGGSPGDSTILVRELLAAPELRTLAYLRDAATVERAWSAGTGTRSAFRVGGSSSPMAGPPLEVVATVGRLGEGAFVNRGPMATGLRVDPGRTVALHLDGGSCLLVAERAIMPNDPELFRHAGIEIGAFDAIVLKGAVAIRAGYRDVVREVLTVGSPGPTACDLATLGLRRVRRPCDPLDATSDEPVGVLRA